MIRSKTLTGNPHRYHFSLRRNIVVMILPFLISLTEKGDSRSVCNSLGSSCGFLMRLNNSQFEGFWDMS